MENAEILELYNRQQRIELDYPDVHREVVGNVIRHISTNGEFGFIIYSNLDENQIEAAIEEQVAHFANLNMAFEWKVYDYDRPADLKERLVKHGFTIGDAEALLVLDLYSEPLVLTYPISPLVRQVTEAGEIDKIMHLEETVWGESHAEHGKRLKTDLAETPSAWPFMPHLMGIRWSAQPGCTITQGQNSPACGVARPCPHIANRVYIPVYWPCAPKKL
jgi:hypothetical protein